MGVTAIMPAKLDRCVEKVKGQKGVDNAYAICNASLKEIKDDDDDPICRHCGKPESEHGLFTKHDFEEDIEHDDEYESGITIIIKEQEKEAVAIGGGLSAVSIGGKKKTQEHHNPLDIPFGHETEIEACPEFDKVHEALMQESYSFENKAGDYMSGPVDEGGPGSGPKKGGGQEEPPMGDPKFVNAKLTWDSLDDVSKTNILATSWGMRPEDIDLSGLDFSLLDQNTQSLIKDLYSP